MLRRFVTFCIASFFVLSTATCYARPNIDTHTILQICEAFGAKNTEHMPGFVSQAASDYLFTTYSQYSEQLKGCLSATETYRTGNMVFFLVQNTRYESYWVITDDDKSIQKISIEKLKPITLADDESWETPKLPAPTPGPPARPELPLPEGPNIWFRPLGGIGALIRFPLGHVGNLPRLPRTIGNEIENGAKTIGKEIEEAESAPNIVEFFYATNRKESVVPPHLEEPPQPASNNADGPVVGSKDWRAVSDYTGERAPQLSVGIIRVRVPEGHHIGKIELPSDHKLFWFTLWRENIDPTKHFTIQSIQATDEENWLRTLELTKKKTALVFVHGFNTKFQDAVFRAAQIIWDLQFKGTTVLFSWPSRGEVADYIYDKESALWSRAALLQVIDDLHKVGFDEVDLIAHSMGNLIAVDALANSASTESPIRIAQLVMAAPDVDRDMFVQDIPGVEKITKGLTLYASKNDRALQLSKRVAGDIPRAGDVSADGPIVLPGLWTIDVSAIGDELFGLNHNTFATTRNVLDDLGILLDRGAPPPRLAEIHAFPSPPQKPAYFRYVP